MSHAGVNLMEQLLCEPEDRLGSESSASISRPDSLVIQARRSGFVNPNVVGGGGSGGSGSVDGVELIKASPVLCPSRDSIAGGGGGQRWRDPMLLFSLSVIVLPLALTPLLIRHTPGSGELTGRTCASILRLSGRNCAAQRILGILTGISLLR